MERIIEDYQEMRTEMFAELGAELGEKPWGDAPNDIGQTRSRCGTEEADGEQVSLVTQSSRGPTTARSGSRLRNSCGG